MVFKVIAFIKKKDGLSAEEFQRYYEERHVAMSNSHGLLPPTLYKRNFLKKGDEINRQDHLLEDVDCITEMGFPSREYYNRWIQVLLQGTSGDDMLKDEAAFIDTASLRYCVVEEVEGAPQLEAAGIAIKKQDI